MFIERISQEQMSQAVSTVDTMLRHFYVAKCCVAVHDEHQLFCRFFQWIHSNKLSLAHLNDKTVSQIFVDSRHNKNVCFCALFVTDGNK